MCGLFGFATRNGRGPDLAKLADVAIATESRGPHAWGLAWIDGRGVMKMYKQPGPISASLDMLSMAEDARLLIGHCRYATHGDPDNNLHNHPHACDGGWMVHNGVITRHWQINQQYGLNPISDCDSETLAGLIEEVGGSLIERCIESVEICGSSKLAMMGLWKAPSPRMIAIRAGNPLHVSEVKRGFYLGSLSKDMPGEPFSVRNDTALSFVLRNGRAVMTAYDASKPALPATTQTTFTEKDDADWETWRADESSRTGSGMIVGKANW